MGQQEALGRLAGDEFGGSEPACTAEFRASASAAGGLRGSTDGNSSIDIVGLKPLKTAALRAEQEDGALQWKSSSPRNTKRRHSGGRTRFAPEFLGLQEGEQAPEQPQPGSNGRELAGGLQHDVNGDSSAAVGSADTHMQQPGQAAGSSAYVSNQQQRQQQQQQQQLEGVDEMPNDEEGADGSGDKEWSRHVCCVCDDGGAAPAAEPHWFLIADSSSLQSRIALAHRAIDGKAGTHHTIRRVLCWASLTDYLLKSFASVSVNGHDNSIAECMPNEVILQSLSGGVLDCRGAHIL